MSTSDQVLQLVGNIGRWQWYIVYFTAFSFLLNTWAILVSVEPILAPTMGRT